MTTFTCFTHPDVLTTGVRDGWADPRTDPTGIDWPARQATAQIPFCVVDGRPVNPHAPTGVRHGRNSLGHWGEALAADAIVLADDNDGQRWLLMVERSDGHGWALPGGMVEPGETPLDAAVRELAEETGLNLPRTAWDWGLASPVYVPDPRASDEAWIVTIACRAWVGRYADPTLLPAVTGDDDANRAAWIRAGSYDQLTGELSRAYGARVFAAHEQLLQQNLDVRADPFGCPHCGAPTGGNPCTNGPAGGPSCADLLDADVLTSPDQPEAVTETWIGAELDDRDPADLRHLAENYLRLVTAIELTMTDVGDWADDERSEVQRLTRYLDHLSQATRGACEVCRRAIYAPHQVTELPRRRWWHPRRWRDAAVDFVGELRYGGHRTAHTSCTRRHH